MTLTKSHLIKSIAEQNGYTRNKSTETAEGTESGNWRGYDAGTKEGCDV